MYFVYITKYELHDILMLMLPFSENADKVIFVEILSHTMLFLLLNSIASFIVDLTYDGIAILIIAPFTMRDSRNFSGN